MAPLDMSCVPRGATTIGEYMQALDGHIADIELARRVLANNLADADQVLSNSPWRVVRQRTPVCEPVWYVTCSYCGSMRDKLREKNCGNCGAGECTHYEGRAVPKVRTANEANKVDVHQRPTGRGRLAVQAVWRKLGFKGGRG